MGTIAEKITYLGETKSEIKDAINLMGMNITNDTFRSYPDKIRDGLLDIMNNGIDTTWNNWEKVTGTGTNVTLNNVLQAPMKIGAKGRSTQKTTQGNQQWNYYSYPVTETTNGVTCTNHGDGTITLNGTCDTDNTRFDLMLKATLSSLLAEGAVAHTAYYISGSCTKAGTGPGQCVIRVDYNQNTSMIPLNTLATSGKITKYRSQTTSTTSLGLQIRVDNGDSFNNFKFRYQLNKGSTELPWEEYTRWNSKSESRLFTRSAKCWR